MNNNQTSFESGCIGMIVVIVLLGWILQDVIGIALVVFIVVFIIALIVEVGRKYYNIENINKKLDYMDNYYKDVDDSVKLCDEYIEDRTIENATIDERLAYLQCICKEVKKIQKED